LRVNNVSGDEVLAEAQTVYPRWPKMTIEEKRPIVQALIEKVILGKDEVELSFSYAPPSEGLCKSQQQLIQLLGCARRKIRIKNAPNGSPPKALKPLPNGVRTIGAQLRFARCESCVSQRDLANRLHLNINRIIGWENDRLLPSPHDLRAIESIIGAKLKI